MLEPPNASTSTSAGSRARNGSMPGWTVQVEVLLLRLLRDGRIGHRWVTADAPAHVSPDEQAVALAGCTDGLCHSTSWRSPRPGMLVLTYAAVPDPHLAEPAEPLDGRLVVSSGQPLHPTPEALDRAHVAAHAVRHLADLALRDPVVQREAARDADLWAAVACAAEQARSVLALSAS